MEGKKPWTAETKYDVALPCATQNEIGKDDAEALVKAGVKLVAEGANMPTESDAIAVFHKNNVVYAPGKVSTGTIPAQHFLCQSASHVCPMMPIVQKKRLKECNELSWHHPLPVAELT